MDYKDAFRPIFSFGSHAAAAYAELGDDSPSPRDVFATLESLLSSALAKRTPVNADHFDKALFAIAAWLDEKLAGIRAKLQPQAPQPLAARFFRCGEPGGEFFEKLNLLLYAEEEDEGDRERRGVIDVYEFCLELGYRGQYPAPMHNEQIDIYLRRCRNILEPPSLCHEDDTLYLCGVAVGGETTSRPGRLLPFWLVPVGFTCCLYSVYQLLLNSLYEIVTG